MRTKQELRRAPPFPAEEPFLRRRWLEGALTGLVLVLQSLGGFGARLRR